jgi:hypothetical protein
MRILFAILLSMVSCALGAANPYGYVITVSPNPVPPGSTLVITIQTTQLQCLPLPSAIGPAAFEGDIVYFSIPTSDGCEMSPLETRSYSVAPLPAGSYVFRFKSCGGFDPETNQDACVIVEDIPVTMFGLSSTTQTVPALSNIALLGLVFLVILVGARLQCRA